MGEQNTIFSVKTFDELTLSELYEIIRTRQDVFIIEQQNTCVEVDGADYGALHVFSMEDGRVLAYLRLLDLGDGVVKVGRVLTTDRMRGLGKALMNAGAAAARERFCAKTLVLDAQEYAIGFYEKCGFSVCSDVFMEEGIPHVKMRMSL